MHRQELTWLVAEWGDFLVFDELFSHSFEADMNKFSASTFVSFC